MFSFKDGKKTRGHEVTLAKVQCRLDIIMFSFSQRTLNEWYTVPADSMVLVVLIFKQIDIYPRRAGIARSIG